MDDFTRPSVRYLTLSVFWVSLLGIPKSLVIWVRGYPKHGDTQITVTPDSRKRRKSSLSVSECRFISNHTNNKLLYSTFEEYLFGDFFSFLSFVNTCWSNHTRVSASNSSRELA